MPLARLLCGAFLVLAAGCPAPPSGYRTSPEQERGLELGAALSAGLERNGGPWDGFEWPVPAGWARDASPLPLPSAPGSGVHGRQEVRLAPGFLQPGATDFRTSGWVWWLPGKQRLSATALSGELADYDRATSAVRGFDPARTAATVIPLGDFSRGRPVRIFVGGVDSALPFTQGASIELTPSRLVRVFTGRASMADASGSGAALRLNLLVSVFDCPRASHTAVLVLSSPQPLRSELWRTLVDLGAQFRCP